MKKILALSLAFSYFLSTPVSANANSIIQKDVSENKLNQEKSEKLKPEHSFNQLKSEQSKSKQRKKIENFVKKNKKILFFSALIPLVGLTGLRIIEKFTEKKGTNQKNPIPQSQLQLNWNVPQLSSMNIPAAFNNINSYQIMQQIGSGSFATVFQISEISSGQVFCMKKIYFHNDDKVLKQLQIESKILYQLYHPNIVRYFHSFIYQDQYCIVMELVDGQPFDAFLSQSSLLLSEDVVIGYFAQMLSAVRFCHENHILHRDIKPANILLNKNGCIKLADFGISKEISPVDMARTKIGTPLYMAPEACKQYGEYSFPADIWSLGCILYEMLTKSLPFGNDPIIFFQNIFNEDPIENNIISPEMKKLIFRMLDKDPTKRITIEQIVREFPSIRNALVKLGHLTTSEKPGVPQNI
ncbi:MAG: serine/threonine-protein kinase [Oscillospiraceae bacterium]|nr:serine/threonine-protein kinase [Oscillospiraceae bacterium]